MLDIYVIARYAERMLGELQLVRTADSDPRNPSAV
jgi:hypothetical protein